MAIILKTSNDQNRILQVRRGSFAFHKVKEYEKFDILLQELKNYWKDFGECADQQLSINMVTVRYLNFIEKDTTETNSDLVTIFTRHPAFSDEINGFVHLKFKYPKNDSISINIVTADAKDNANEGVILDIFLNRKINDETDVATVFQYISELRAIKNTLFFKCVTKKMTKKYNQ